MTKLLTLKEIAKDLGVPESSLRKYREIFHAFIPSVGEGRSRRYRSQATEILNEIRLLREEKGLPWDAISEELAKKYPMDAVSTEIPNPAATAGQPSYKPAQAPTSYAIQPQHSATAQNSAPMSDSKANDKLSAMAERQAMMMNAVAIELLQSIEKVSQTTKKDSRNLTMNMARAMETLYHSITVAAAREEKILTDIQNKLDSLEKTITKSSADQVKIIALAIKASQKNSPFATKSSPAQSAPSATTLPLSPSPSSPPSPPVDNNGATAEEARKVAELKKAYIVARENLKKKDLIIQEFKTQLEAAKRETADLRRSSSSSHSHSRDEEFTQEEEGGYEPKSSTRKKSLFGRFSRK